MKTNRAPWDYEHKQKDDGKEYETSICSTCGQMVIYNTDGKAICADCGETAAMKIPSGQFLEFRETLKACGNLFGDLCATVADVYSGGMYTRHPEVFQTEQERDAEWLGAHVTINGGEVEELGPQTGGEMVF